MSYTPEFADVLQRQKFNSEAVWGLSPGPAFRATRNQEQKTSTWRTTGRGEVPTYCFSYCESIHYTLTRSLNKHHSHKVHFQYLKLSLRNRMTTRSLNLLSISGEYRPVFLEHYYKQEAAVTQKLSFYIQREKKKKRERKRAQTHKSENYIFYIQPYIYMMSVCLCMCPSVHNGLGALGLVVSAANHKAY